MVIRAQGNELLYATVEYRDEEWQGSLAEADFEPQSFGCPTRDATTAVQEVEQILVSSAQEDIILKPKEIGVLVVDGSDYTVTVVDAYRRIFPEEPHFDRTEEQFRQLIFILAN